MKRKIEVDLLAWKHQPGRMPLLLNGARQVGKSYSVKAFGAKHYPSLLTINFELDEAFLSFFETSLRPRDIIKRIEQFFGVQIRPDETLLFFDEIQLCERALTSLKYFTEEAPEYHIIGAGSLLGLTLNRTKSAYPVGKVIQMSMYPMDFQEFLWANGQAYLEEQIALSAEAMSPLSQSLHQSALNLLNQYYLTGGMPASVATHLSQSPVVSEQQIRQFILAAYAADIAKFVDASQAVRIRACYDSIPQQLAKDNKKFQYKLAMKGGRASLLGDAVDWLVQSGIVLKADLTTSGEMPPAAAIDPASFKLYSSDIGLLASQVNLTGSALQMNPQWQGIMAENYVAQSLVANGHQLLYWTSGNTAELDFVLVQQGQVVPLEVKSSTRVRSRSLDYFIKKYRPTKAFRLSERNFGLSDGIHSLPLYAAYTIRA